MCENVRPGWVGSNGFTVYLSNRFAHPAFFFFSWFQAFLLISKAQIARPSRGSRAGSNGKSSIGSDGRSGDPARHYPAVDGWCHLVNGAKRPLDGSGTQDIIKVLTNYLELLGRIEHYSGDVSAVVRIPVSQMD